MEKQLFFPNDLLIEWFKSHKRSLPWREGANPYQVWVSEVMLQQTRVSVVISYFERWLARFPTIESLAKAPLEEVIKMWEGLGYYSRARNLHKGAQQCMTHFGGKVPENESDLSSISGIGPYTLAALLNFAFHKKKPLIDGNVLRVMSRFYAIVESIDSPSIRAFIEKKMEGFLPEDEFWVVSEALMEVGALLCLKKPLCHQCPLQKNCAAHQQGIEEKLPLRKARREIITLERHVAIIECNEKVALQKGLKGKVMADLYEFPYVEIRDSPQTFLGEELTLLSTLPKRKHHFTHHRVTLIPFLYHAKKEDPRWIWVDKDQLLELPFSSGHRRILENYLENITH